MKGIWYCRTQYLRSHLPGKTAHPLHDTAVESNVEMS